MIEDLDLLAEEIVDTLEINGIIKTEDKPLARQLVEDRLQELNT